MGRERNKNTGCFVLTEGNTEEYFLSCLDEIYYELCNNRIIRKIKSKQGQGKTIIDKAISFKKNSKFVDPKTLTVFDVDNSTENDLKKVKSMCKNHDIDYCITNPCFEMIGLLFFDYNINSIITIEQAQKEFAKLLSKYLNKKILHTDIKNEDFLKNNNIFKKLILERLHIAYEKSKKLYDEKSKDLNQNPCTNFHLMIDYFNNLAGENILDLINNK